MKLEKRIDITKAFIFSKIDAFDIFKMYVPEFKLKETICSPLRVDKSPSWGVFVSDGTLLYKDLATGECGNCITLVEKMFGLNYDKALQKIAMDFQMVNGTDDYKKIINQYGKPVMSEKRHSLIQVTVRRWNKHLLQYWADYGIDQKDLEKEEIYPIKEWFLNRKKQQLGENERCYAYRYDIGFQILMPDRDKTTKWKTNMPLSYIDGLSTMNGSDKVLITKAKKDKIYLQKLLPFPVIRTMNESISAFTEEVIEKLRGKQVWVNFDVDTAGKNASWKVTELLKCKHLNVPDMLLDEKITDFTDWRRVRGSDDEIIQFLKQKKLL